MVRAKARRGSTRAARGSITPEGIVAAALVVLGRDGLAGVTIRGVARELGTAPMSLYRHVRDHAALVEMLRQRVMTPPPRATTEPTQAGWRETLRSLMHGARAQLKQYPGAVELFESNNFRQPAASFALERALECLAAAGLDSRRAAQVSAVLWMFTVGDVLAEASDAAAWPTEDLAPSRRRPWVSEIQGVLRAQAPRVAATLPRWAALSHDEVFAAGLELLLAGIEATVATRGPVRHAVR